MSLSPIVHELLAHIVHLIENNKMRGLKNLSEESLEVYYLFVFGVFLIIINFTLGKT